MKTVIVVNPFKIETINHLSTPIEPQDGEYVKLITELGGEAIGSGSVTNVRTDKDWPGRFLYDVKVASKET